MHLHDAKDTDCLPVPSVPQHRDCHVKSIQWHAYCCWWRSSVCISFTWLSAAFDTVDHDLLMLRLEHQFGLRAVMLMPVW